MRVRTRCALAIGGNDPGGGAGIAADLRAFAAAGAFGCAAVAVLTVQSTAGLRSARAVDARELGLQVREVVRHQRVGAVKTGALGSPANVRVVGAWAERCPRVPLVVDPVMLPTRGRAGARLLARDALHLLRVELLARATLVTANAPEAAAIVGREVRTVAEAREAAVAICALGARAALVKGGHLDGRDAIDGLAFAGPHGRIVERSAKRLRLGPGNGGGCTLASLIAGRLALANLPARGPAFEAAILRAVRWAKRRHHTALARAIDVGGPMGVLVP